MLENCHKSELQRAEANDNAWPGIVCCWSSGVERAAKATLRLVDSYMLCGHWLKAELFDGGCGA